MVYKRGAQSTRSTDQAIQRIGPYDVWTFSIYGVCHIGQIYKNPFLGFHFVVFGNFNCCYSLVGQSRSKRGRLEVVIKRNEASCKIYSCEMCSIIRLFRWFTKGNPPFFYVFFQISYSSMLSLSIMMMFVRLVIVYSRRTVC